MDTNNINLNGLPSEEELEKLANIYFQSPPLGGVGFSPQQLANESVLENHLQNQGNIVDVNDPALNINQAENLRSGGSVSPSAVEQTNMFRGNDYQQVLPRSDLGYDHLPKSEAGSGVSPSALEKEGSFNIYNPQTSLVDSPIESEKNPRSIAGSGISPSAMEQNNMFKVSDYQPVIPSSDLGYDHLPKSEAGSGVSPSALEKEGSFNIYNPQTNLVDPHFEDGKIPRSVAGSGVSPSLVKKEDSPLPASDGSQVDGLNAVLREMISYIAASQLPEGGNSAINEPVFYFLSGTNYFNKDIGHEDSFKNKPANTSGPSGRVQVPFDFNLVKRDFPILSEQINGKQIVWLDNAATTQKPKQVMERLNYFYEHENSNVHRAAHDLAARATDAYETARKKVRQFLNAKSENEIVFLRGTTEAINLVAQSWGDQYLKPGDEIILTHLEHHANIVPWQLLARKKGLIIRVAPVDDSGQIILEAYARLLNGKTKLVSFTQVSNALGTVTPAKQMIEMAHGIGARVLIDGAQSVAHMRTDVLALNADWFVFSGHKIFAPTGIGVLYGKEELLNQTQPWQGGGSMIKDVTFEKTEFNNAPSRFEAGTGNIADAVGLGAALDYLTKIGIDLISQYEHALLLYGNAQLKTVPGLRLIGTAHEKASVMSFVLDGFTNDEVGQALNKEGIAVRTGHHCAQPILRRFGLESTVRPSLAFYNSCADIDRLVEVLLRLKKS